MKQLIQKIKTAIVFAFIYPFKGEPAAATFKEAIKSEFLTID